MTGISSKARLAYCRVVAGTGNLSLAAAEAGHHRTTFERLRRRDPVFAAQVANALAEARCNALKPPRGAAGPKRNDRLTQGGEWVIQRGSLRPQIRRARPGMLTEGALDAFLAALANTGNITLAAHSIGVSYECIWQRRKRDRDFDHQVREAMERGTEVLNGLLIETALRSLDERIGDAPEDWPTIGRMSATDAFALLCKQDEFLRRPPPWDPARIDDDAGLAAAKLHRLMERMRAERSRDEALARGETVGEWMARRRDGADG